MEKALDQDRMTGRLHAFDMQVEGGAFVFKAKNDDDWVRNNNALPSKEESFLGFASLRDDAKRQAEKEGCQGEEEAYYEEALERFARAQGPLFGYGLGKARKVVKEPITDWKNAQSVVDTAFRLAEFAQGGKLADDLKGVVSYHVGGMFDFARAASILFKFPPSDLYETCLNERSDTQIAFGPEFHRSIWWGRGMQIASQYISSISGMEGITREVNLDEIDSYPTARRDFQSLLEPLIYGHLGGVEMGFKEPGAPVGSQKGNWTYGVVSTCYLSYMWHDFAQSYSQSTFKKCANPKCSRLMVVDTSTKTNKRFCSAKCKAQASNMVLSEQNHRARLAYYDCLSYGEIYEKAFERKLSFKDPDRKALCSRLDRWIEKDFSKSKKGQKATKAGAGRKE